MEYKESVRYLFQGLDKKFPHNESLRFLKENDVIINFVLRDYIADAFEKLPEKDFFNHLMGLLDGVVFFYKKYKSISDIVQRVKVFHTDVDEIISKNLFGKDNIGPEILCSKGCSNCCSQLVTVSKSEGEHLLSTKNNIDRDQLFRQSQCTTKTWTQNLNEEQGKCVFLNRTDGSCDVWNHRPANCRNYFVTGQNTNCSVFNRNPDVSRSIKSIYADVCISAFYSLDGGEVSMSNYLYEKLL